MLSTDTTMSMPKPLFPVLLVLLAGGCPGTGDDLSEADGLIQSVQLKGRVVDFESCIAKTGCMGVGGVQVALFYNRQHVTAKTPTSGAFTLRVPDGVPVFLFVMDPGSTYLPTLTASPINTGGADIYNVEVFVLKRTGGLYEGIQQDSPTHLKRTVSIQSDALYLGQVFKVEKGSMKAIDFVTAHSFPTSTIMYVNCNPRFKTNCKGQKTLGGAKETTIFGQFLAVGKSGKGDYAVWATAKDFNFGPVMAPIGPGYITIGTHKGIKK